MRWWEWDHIIEAFQTYASTLANRAIKLEFIDSDDSCVDLRDGHMYIHPYPYCPAAEGFALTKARIAHEAAHQRYSTPVESDGELHRLITNILEDIRVEDAISSEYPGLFPGFMYRCNRVIQQTPDLQGDDSAQELVTAMKQVSAGFNPKGMLGPGNQERLKKILPLMFKAWRMNHSQGVAKIAKKIVELFPPLDDKPDLPPPMTEQMQGERNDKPEMATFNIPLRVLKPSLPENTPKPDKPDKDEDKDDNKDSESGDGDDYDDDDGEADDEDSDENNEDGDEGESGDDEWEKESKQELNGLLAGTERCSDDMDMRPYIDMMNSCKLNAHRLARFLQRLPPKPEDDRPAKRGRLSIREYMRNPEKPFLANNAPSKYPELSLGILVDVSGSMSGRIRYLAPAVMTIYLACRELKIDFAIWAFTSWEEPYKTIKPFEGNTIKAPAFIAGLSSVGGTRLKEALKALIPQMRARRADRKVLMVIHDGEPDDYSGTKREIYQAHRRGDMEIMGIFLTEKKGEDTGAMAEIFGNRFRVIEPKNLATALSSYLIQLMQVE